MIKFTFEEKDEFKPQFKDEEYVERHRILDKIECFASTWYYSMYSPNPTHPKYLNILKNDKKTYPPACLSKAKDDLKDQISETLPNIIEYLNRPIVICTVPRAKIENYYAEEQLYFKLCISEYIRSLNNKNIEDGTTYIERTADTKTTHFGHRYMSAMGGDGSTPYFGIAKDTCTFNENKLKDKNILLIDDIYTESVNIDEDFLLTLHKIGVSSLKFYAIAYTHNRQRNKIEEI